MSRRNVRAPKRRIGRKYYRVNDQMTNAVQSIDIMDSVTDPLTIVRVIYDLTIVWNQPTAAGPIGYEIQLALWPQGVNITDPVTTGGGDTGITPKEEMWRRLGGMYGDTDIQPGNYNFIYRDIKGMRKLDRDDKIVLSYIASQTDTLWLMGSITILYKEV